MSNENKNRSFTRALIFLLVIGGFFSLTSLASAATFNISPTSGSFGVGETFSVWITVSSTDQALNAVDGTVSFPTDKLQVLSVPKESSIINLWVEEPTFSNSTGKVSLSGVVLNPGFFGSTGRVLKINFKVKKAGNAAVIFSAGSILANDGQGTNILNGFNNGQFSLVNKVEVKNTTPAPPAIPETTAVSSISPTFNHLTEEIKTVTPISSPAFLQELKAYALNISMVLLLLIILVIVCFLLLRSWYAVMMLKSKLRNEAELDRKNQEQLIAVKKKLIESEHLAETTEAELLYQQGLLSAEKAKREGAEEEARRSADLVREREMNLKKEFEDRKSGFEEDARKSADLAKEREANLKREFEDSRSAVERELENARSQTTAIQKKLMETERLIEETKSQLVYQVGLLSAEKAKSDQAAQGYYSTLASFEERESNLKKELKETQFSLAQEQGGDDQKIFEYKKRISDTEHLLEETKSELAREQGLLAMQKDKVTQLEEENKKYHLDLREKEVALEKNLDSLEVLKGREVTLKGSLAATEEEIASAKNKLNETLTQVKETKMALEQELERATIEKSKREELEGKYQKLTALSNEKELEFKKKLDETQAQTKEKETALKKKFEDVAEAQVTETKAKLTEALRVGEGLKADLSKAEKLLASEQNKTKNLMTAFSKFISSDSSNLPNS